MDWSVILPAALAGMASGVVGSLIAPWVHWKIRKNEGRREARKLLVQQIKEWAEQDRSKEEFRNSYLYHQLKPELSKDLVKTIEHPRLAVVGGFWSRVLEELSAVEKKWGLI